MDRRLPMIAVSVLALLAGCARAGGAGYEPMAWGCQDLVVEGVLVTTGYIDMSSEDDLIGHGEHSGTLTTSRVLRRRAPGRKLKVTYYAHPKIVSSPLRFVLIPLAEGFTIRSLAFPRSQKARLAKHCDPALDRPVAPPFSAT